MKASRTPATTVGTTEGLECHSTFSVRATYIAVEDLCEWQSAKRVVLGIPSGPASRAIASVGISQGVASRWRIDVSPSAGHSSFQDVRCVGDVVFIGFGQQVAVFSPKTEDLVSYSLDGYFGHLFTAVDLVSSDLGSSVLVASASKLLRFDGAGRLLWRSAGLGVDGVVVHRVEGSEIFGDGDWDPPGGWEPFRLQLDSGAECRS